MLAEFWRKKYWKFPKVLRRESWFRAKDRIPILHKFINLWQIKIPKFINDLPGGRRKGSSSIRIIFTKLSQDTILIGGMTANVNRFQWNTPPNQKVYFGCAETICLINQEARSAAFLVVNVKDFLEKGGEKIKMESQKPCKCRLRDSERLLVGNCETSSQSRLKMR